MKQLKSHSSRLMYGFCPHFGHKSEHLHEDTADQRAEHVTVLGNERE